MVTLLDFIHRLKSYSNQTSFDHSLGLEQKGQEKIIHLVTNLSVIYNDHGAN